MSIEQRMFHVRLLNIAEEAAEQRRVAAEQGATPAVGTGGER